MYVFCAYYTSPSLSASLRCFIGKDLIGIVFKMQRYEKKME
jgi:hypothetical protein